MAQRFDWPEGGTPTSGFVREIADANGVLLFGLHEARAVAVDANSASLWMLAYRHHALGTQAARLGHDGRVVEAFDVKRNVFGETVQEAAVCFDDDADRFLFGYAIDRSQDRVEIAEYLYDGAAVPTEFGVTCGGNARATSRHAPARWLAGDLNASIALSGAQPGVAARLYLSRSPAAFPLPLPLSNGCELLLDPAVLIEVASGVVSTGGTFAVPVPLPSTAFGVDVAWQFLLLSPSGIASSDGVITRIR